MLVADVDIGVEALQDGERNTTVYFHESGRHHVAHSENESQEWNWLVDVFFEFWDVGDEEVADGGVEDADGGLAEEEEEGADSISNKERSSILKSKNKRLHSRSTEILPSQSNLNICILINEFDKSMEAVKAAAGAVEHATGKGVFIFDFFHLFVDDFEDEADSPNNSQKKSTESKRALIIFETPNKSLTQAKIAASVLRRRKVPRASSNNDGVLEKCLDEFHDPEVAEYLEPHHVLLFLSKFDCFVLAAKFRLSDFA